jgi:hypothetical protein
MREVSPGDLIFSFMDTKIQAIGIISREGILFREPPDMAGGPVFSAQRRANLDADRSRHTLAFAAAFADANANADANVSLLQT